MGVLQGRWSIEPKKAARVWVECGGALPSTHRKFFFLNIRCVLCILRDMLKLGGRLYSDRLCSDRRYSDNLQSRRPSASLARLAYVEIVETRMVQLPATAAIEYVAACWVSGARGIFVRGCFCPGGLLPGGLLSGGLMPVPAKFNAYTHHLGFLCLAS